MPVRASRTIPPTRILTPERTLTSGIGDGAAVGWSAIISHYETISTVRLPVRILPAVR